MERQILFPAFHAQHFRSYGETIRAIARQKTESWQAGQTVRALATALSISMDVIMNVVFGMKDGELINEGRRILRNYDIAMGEKNGVPLVIKGRRGHTND